MSSDPLAEIFYGYVWNGKIPFPIPEGAEEENEPSRWITYLLIKRGMKDPWAEDSFNPQEDTEKRKDQWMDKTKDAEREFRVEASSFGDTCRECDMPECLMIPESKQYTYGEDALILIPEHFKIDSRTKQEWDQRLDTFLNEFDLTKPAPEPSWYLVSSYV